MSKPTTYECDLCGKNGTDEKGSRPVIHGLYMPAGVLTSLVPAGESDKHICEYCVRAIRGNGGRTNGRS